MSISIYTEATPNPETLKFVANKLLYPGKSIEISKDLNADVSPLAQELFTFPFVQSVFIASNFVTVTKSQDTDWESVKQSIKDVIMQYLTDEKPIILEDKIQQHIKPTTPEEDEQIIKKVEEILENYVKPAVEMDGGAIQLKKYENGKVYVSLQGSCNGCPSSSITLKAGIEKMMRQMVPQVTEVIAE